ncbi:type I polyketide synthase, partial [Streptomyces sp. TRM 70351]|uniref:type I polyketide synthase n=1 Tax=Streptomyces sp. TRM 70351 TaxID=3116552 RepID=UPI002E7BAE0F
HHETATVVTALAHLHTLGAPVDWSAYFAPAAPRHVTLPGYAFQHRRYWLEPTPGGAGAGADGHPLIGEAVPVAGGEQVLFTGRVSLRTHPWFAERPLHGAPVVPPAALVEAAVHAADRLGAASVDRLTLRRPVALPEQGDLHVQLSVAGPGEDGKRTFSVHSRPAGDEAVWTLHADGALGAPVDGARPDDTGPAGPDGGDAYEAALPEELLADAARYALHPALLALAVDLAGDGDPDALPAEWHGVRLHATGATQAQVRTASGTGGPVLLRDAAGEPVVSVAAVTFRTFAPEDVAGARRTLPLHTVVWEPVSLPAGPSGAADGRSWEVLPVTHDGTGPDEVHAAVGRTLEQVREWLSDESGERGEDTVLAVVTRGAVAADEGGTVSPAGAAVWGLLRSVQAEAPDRVVLLDLAPDGGGEPGDVLPALLAAGEPQAAVRDGSVRVPRLRRSDATGATAGAAPVWSPEGTVLVTGGTGALGALAARHLVTAHGVRHLLLLSRSGPDAPAATGLREELAELGATVTVAACDAADRDALAAVLDRIPGDRPLTGVVHTAGVLDNGLFPAMTPERLATALRPKADAAWHLHELTRGADLTAFVLFSSTVGVIGGPGQANYAAANAALDGLAAHRAALGLPATSVAWGLWDLPEGTGVNAALDSADRARYAREGFRAVPPQEGLRLLDAALASAAPAVVALPLDAAAMRAHGRVPHVLRGLVRVPERRAAQAGGAAPRTLADRLAELPGQERLPVVLDLVRSEVAAVLGHTDPGSLGAEQAFQELGFDSMTAVELRNRLGAVAGVRLPATLVFDHPTPDALAAFLLRQVAPEEADGPRTVLARLSDLEAELAALDGDAETVSTVSIRLQTMLSRLSESAAATASAGAADTLAEASASEIFDFIDNQLGRSAT